MKEPVLKSLKRSIRSIGWRCVPRERYESGFLHLVDHFPPVDVCDVPSDAILAGRLDWERSTYYSYRYREFVLELKGDLIVEPRLGMVFSPDHRIYKDALALPLSGHFPKGFPVPFLPQLKFEMATRKTRTVDKAILLRHWYGDGNYFHFYNDLVSRLALLEEKSVASDWPIIVAKKLYDSAHFQGFIDATSLREREWIVQDKEYIRAGRMVIAKANVATATGIKRVQSFLGVGAEPANTNKRVYIYRGGGNKRELRNADELKEIAERHGFEAVDPGAMPYDRQVRLFSGTRFLAGEHGAGFANILFRGEAPLSLLELFPPNREISTCYFLICQAMGYSHSVLRGQGTDAQFRIEPKTFEEALKKMVDS